MLARALAIVILLCSQSAHIDATTAVPHRSIKVFISPGCKSMYYGRTALEHGDDAARRRPSWVDWDITGTETIATGSGIRERARLRKRAT